MTLDPTDDFPFGPALLREIASMLAVPPPIMPVAPARRFVKRGFYMCCVECGKAVEWCACIGKPAQDVGSQDGAAADSLAKRIEDCKESK